MTQNEDILTTVVENGRITTWTKAEMEVEIEFECSARGLSAEETADAVAFALAHSNLKDGTTMVYQITTKPGDLQHDYRAFGEWEEASDLEEVWFVTVDASQSDALESLLDTDTTVVAYEVVSVEA